MDILVSGVGGQGTILTSKILAKAAVLNGSSCARTGETIGMSQRGGCVVSHVRTENTFSPYIPMRSADLLLSFELCEGARNIAQLKKDGIAIVNTAQINPVSVSLGVSEYSSEKIKKYISDNSKAYFIDANAVAEKSGTVKAVNIVLIGFAFGLGLLKISKEAIVDSIKQNVSSKFYELDVRAFEAGIACAQNI